MKFDSFINKHKGQRCFILGAGPSLSDEKLELLDNSIVFVCNNAFLARDQKNLKKINYYVICDHTVYHDIHTNYNSQLKNMSATKIYSSKIKEIWPDLCFDENFIEFKKYYTKPFAFPTQFDDGWGSTKTVVIDTSIIAYFMGFSEIYWLGVDISGYNSKKTHFYKTGKREEKLVKRANTKNTLDAIKTISSALESQDVKLVNLSKGFLHKDAIKKDKLENIIGKEQ